MVPNIAGASAHGPQHQARAGGAAFGWAGLTDLNQAQRDAHGGQRLVQGVQVGGRALDLCADLRARKRAWEGRREGGGERTGGRGGRITSWRLPGGNGNPQAWRSKPHHNPAFAPPPRSVAGCLSRPPL